jgi:hypothetical protein
MLAVAAKNAIPALSGTVSSVFTKIGNLINTNAARRGRLALIHLPGSGGPPRTAAAGYSRMLKE